MIVFDPTKPSEFKTVKQPHGSKLCTAAVTAMAAGVSLDEVLLECRTVPLAGDPVGYMPDIEMYKFLAKRGIVCGLHFGGDGYFQGDEVVLQINDTLRRPAIFSVYSQIYKHAEHSVFFDGENVRDPLVSEGETSPIWLYKIRLVMPLTYTRQPDDAFLQEIAELRGGA